MSMEVTSDELKDMIESLPYPGDWQGRRWKIPFPVRISPVLVSYQPEMPYDLKHLEFISKRFSDDSFRWVIDL